MEMRAIQGVEDTRAPYQTAARNIPQHAALRTRLSPSHGTYQLHLQYGATRRTDDVRSVRQNVDFRQPGRHLAPCPIKPKIEV